MSGIEIIRRELTAAGLRAAAGKCRDARAARRKPALAPERDGVVRWRRQDPPARIAAAFGVEVQERTVGKYLAVPGFRRLSLRPQHPKSDPDAHGAFKKTSPRQSRPRSPSAQGKNPSNSGSGTTQGSASKAPSSASGPDAAPDPVHRAIGAITGPVCLARSVWRSLPGAPHRLAEGAREG